MYTHAHIYTAWLLASFFFFLTNYALFPVYLHLFLFSSLCLSFLPQYDFHLQIGVPLSTQNLLRTGDINILSIGFNMMNNLNYFSFLPYCIFSPGWNNFYFSFL